MNVVDTDGYALKFDFGNDVYDDVSEFTKPLIIRDILAKKENVPDIILINEGESVDFLITIDLSFYAQEIHKEEAWVPRQKYRYYIRSIHLVPEENSKIVSKVPRNHQIMIDRANRKLMLLGDMIGAEINSTDWIKF